MISLFFRFTDGIFRIMLLKAVSRNTAMLDEKILRGFPQQTLTRMLGEERMLRAAKRFISGSRDRVGHRPDRENAAKKLRVNEITLLLPPPELDL
ncbi:hypothetical protein ALC56_06273 [Trachymyrmex septentrionalis]|uniref:Uncharacterized protein n=1 Tax=Trachymyrmex septentrionalis TaxID=34720 RepID=A0A195FGJ1_9HYME|nr:hypothetical protein ALC56_06273 [Trachymyrmex septentrionalis]